MSDEVAKVRAELHLSDHEVDEMEGYDVVPGQDSGLIHDHKFYYHRNVVITDGIDFFRIEQGWEIIPDHGGEVHSESVRQVFPVDELKKVYK